MNICIPIEEDLGLSSEISLHFSRAPMFIVVNTQTLSFEVFDRKTLGAETDAGQILMITRRADIERVVVGGIGLEALAELQDADLEVFSSTKDTVREIIEEGQQGTLTPIALGDNCKNRSRGFGRGFNGGTCGGTHGCGHC